MQFNIPLPSQVGHVLKIGCPGAIPAGVVLLKLGEYITGVLSPAPDRSTASSSEAKDMPDKVREPIQQAANISINFFILISFFLFDIQAALSPETH